MSAYSKDLLANNKDWKSGSSRDRKQADNHDMDTMADKLELPEQAGKQVLLVPEHMAELRALEHLTAGLDGAGSVKLAGRIIFFLFHIDLSSFKPKIK